MGSSKRRNEKKQTKVRLDKAVPSEAYLQAMNQLVNAVRNNDINQLKSTTQELKALEKSVMDKAPVIDGETKDAILKSYHDSDRNPLKKTNLIILACLHNNAEAVEFYLQNDINQMLSNHSGRVLQPDERDEHNHTAFYYAIRSGNVTLLNGLVNFWLIPCFKKDTKKFDLCMSTAYDELLLHGVQATDEVKYYVLETLMNLRLANPKIVCPSSVKDIEARKDMLLLRIETIVTNPTSTVDATFLYEIKFIAQNINILKQQLRSTYDSVPWEEIEFLLVCFLSAYMTYTDLNIFYRSTLTRDNLLRKLKSFVQPLKELRCFKTDLDVRVLNEPIACNREKIIAEIQQTYPSLQELYREYTHLRDIYTLDKIHSYTSAALQADCGNRMGRLAVKRALQVVGEHLNNTLESPKLSTAMARHLLDSAPKKTRQILISVRHSLSHKHLSENEDDSKNLSFFNNVQNDLKTIGDVVFHKLYSEKVKKINYALTEILRSESEDQIIEILDMFRYINIVKDWNPPTTVDPVNEPHPIELLIKDIDLTMMEKTDNEKYILNEIGEIIKQRFSLTTKEKINKYVSDFYILQATLVSLFNDENDIIYGKKDRKITDNSKDKIRKLLHIFSLQSSNFDAKSEIRLRQLLDRLQESIAPRLSSNQQVWWTIKQSLERICKWITSQQSSIEWIETFQTQWNTIQKESYNVIATNNSKNYKQICALKKEVEWMIRSISDKATSDKITFTRLVIEALMLDILLNQYNYCQVNGVCFLDESIPLLTGKNLRNHLAHGNALIHILFPDIFLMLLLNTKTIIQGDKTKMKNKAQNLKKVMEKYEADKVIIGVQCEMFTALEEANYQLLKNSIRKGADPNARRNKCWSTVHQAVKGGCTNSLEYLIKKNIKCDTKDSNGRTPLHIAAANGRTEVLTLLAKGSDMNERNNIGRTALHMAAANGHSDTVRALLKLGAKPELYDDSGCSPLYWALQNGQKATVEILLQMENGVNTKVTRDGLTSLHVAAETGQTDLMKRLMLCKNVDMNPLTVVNGVTPHVRGVTPLQMAAANGHLPAVLTLMENGAGMNPESRDMALQFAVDRGHINVVEVLLEFGASADFANEEGGYTALHMVALNCHASIANLLLKYKVNIDAVRSDGATALMCAAINGRTEMVELFIRHGARLNCVDINGLTALHVSSMCGHQSTVRVLIENGIDANMKDNFQNTALDIALQFGRFEIVEILREVTLSRPAPIVEIRNTEAAEVTIYTPDLKNKYDTDLERFDGNGLLHIAASNGNYDVAKTLISRGANVNENIRGSTPLLSAIKGRHLLFIELLLQNNANVSGTDYPLHAAVFDGCLETVETLLYAGANYNAKNGKNETPLEISVARGNADIVNRLLQYRDIDINVKVLHLAVSSNNLGMVKNLIQKGADCNIADESGSKPVHIAASEGNLDMLRLFLENMSVDELGAQRMTLLHYAASAGHVEIINFLIKRKIDVNSIDMNGFRPIHCAAQRGHSKIVDILLNNGASFNCKDNAGLRPLNWTMDEKIHTVLEATKRLHLAVKSDNSYEMNIEIRKGANIEAKNSKTWTALHIATWRGNVKACEALLENNANPNAKGKSEATPLHYAAKLSHFKIVKLLLKHGAVHDIENSNGIIPILLTEDERIVSLLRLIAVAFDDIQMGNLSIVNILQNITDEDKIKAVMRACNKDGKTLIVTAIESNYQKIEELKQIYQKNPTPKTDEMSEQHALMVLNKILAERRNILGDYNPGTLDIMEQIAMILCKISSIQKSLDLLESVYKERCKLFGCDDKLSLRTKKNMAFVLRSGDKHNDALKLYKEVCESKVRMFGKDHRDVLETKMNMAFSLCALGRFEEALKTNSEVQNALTDKKDVLKLQASSNIAEIFEKLNLFEDALLIYKDLFLIAIMNFGSKHKDTLRYLSKILNIMVSQQRKAEIYDFVVENMIANVS